MAQLREVASDLSSRSSSGIEGIVRIRLNFGGHWTLQADNKWQYVDGETYLEKLSTDIKYADLMHMVNEKINGSAIFKYTPPGEEPSPNNLVTVVDDPHLQEMLDLIEEFKVAQSSPRGKTFRLLVWLSRAAEEVVIGDDMFMTGEASETGESDMSDGTHSPMPHHPHWSPYNNSAGHNDVDMQAMVAEEDCNYMNAMEEAESTEASRPHYQYPLKQLSSDEWFIVPSMVQSSNDRYEQSSAPHDNDEVSLPSTRKLSSLNPSTPNPDTPPPSQQADFKLPSSLGSSLGHAHRQVLISSTKPSPYRLPSKLGSSLGNPRSGTLRDLNPSSLTRATYKIPSKTSGMLKPPLVPDVCKHGKGEPPTGRTTPNGTPIPSGNGMDHFHTVPASQLKPIAKLGEGTFGEVLQCFNRLFGDIAVKCAKAEGDQDLFSQELRMLSSLNHPNVLRFFGVVIDDTQESKIVGVITEFMQGRSLSYYLGPEVPRWSLLERAKLARGAVNGLMYLHKHDIIHFDLKPENLLLDYPMGRGGFTPGIKVADFGLAKYKVDSYASTDSGLRGTLPYMSPEVGGSGAPVTEKADIWSLGMVLWEMFTHSVPYGNLSAPEITARLRSGNAFPCIPPDMEQEWAELIEACCRPSPNDRFSLENIAAMLDQVIQNELRRPNY